MTIECTLYTSLSQVDKELWEADLSLPLHLSYNSLRLVEESGINDLSCFYLRFHEGESEVARANAYIVQTDLSTMDQETNPNIMRTVKGWYPDFLTFRVLECGYFTFVGNGIGLSECSNLEVILDLISQQIEQLASENSVDFTLYRDIASDQYQAYKKVLAPKGYKLCQGFSNTELPIQWTSMEEYFRSLKSSTRYKLKKSVDDLLPKYDIEYFFTTETKAYLKDVLRLWNNVEGGAQEYSREKLNERYFELLEELLGANSELLVFTHKGTPVAFMYNLFDDETYFMNHWGVDYNFEYYRTSNLFRAANTLCIKRCIEKKLSVLELGVTNYGPKYFLGAQEKPLYYFAKHQKEPELTTALADLITESIKQPSNPNRPFKDMERYHHKSEEPLEVKSEINSYGNEDLFYKVDDFQKHNILKLSKLYRFYPQFSSSQNSTATIEGRSVVLLGSNSYLGYSTNPTVKEATQKAVELYGTGCSGSPFLNGTLTIHRELEKELARFMNREAVMLCSTGYQTNLAGISALCSVGDAVVLDRKSHRSLFDGARLSGADIFTYKHNDIHHLEKVLKHLKGRRKLLVTDSVFSMEGTIVDLLRIADLAEAYGARLFVDEAHAVGVLGENGRGVCELQDVEDRVDLIMCTFSKSFGAIGGFIAGDAKVINFMRHKAGAHAFSASLPPSAVATVQAALHCMREGAKDRELLLQKAHYMSQKLTKMGFNAPYKGTPIVPVILGDELLALGAYKKLLDLGVYVNPILTPAVSEEHVGFRTSYLATHRWEDLNLALEKFRDLKKDIIEG